MRSGCRQAGSYGASVSPHPETTAIKRSLLRRCPTWYVIEPPTSCQMLASGTLVGVQMRIARESRFLFDHALPLVAGCIELVQELVERDPEIPAIAMLLDGHRRNAWRAWLATVHQLSPHRLSAAARLTVMPNVQAPACHSKHFSGSLTPPPSPVHPAPDRRSPDQCPVCWRFPRA
jgi:hypothetical protein